MDISDDCNILLQKVVSSLNPDLLKNKENDKRYKKKHLTDLMFALSWFSRKDNVTDKEVKDAVNILYDQKMGIKAKVISI